MASELLVGGDTTSESEQRHPGCSAAPRRPLLLLALAMLGTLGSWPRVGSVYLGYVEGVFHWMTDGGLLTASELKVFHVFASC